MRQKRRKPHLRTGRIACILTLSVGILAGCSDTVVTSTDATSVYKDQVVPSIKAFKVIKQKIGEPLERTAEVQSSAQFIVLSKAVGDIEQVLKKRGDMVQEGDVIVKLKSSEALIQRDSAAAAITAIQEAIEKAKVKAQKETENQRTEMSNAIQKMELNMTTLLRSYNKMKNDYDIGLATKAQLYQMETQMMNARMDLDQLKKKQGQLEPVDATSALESQLKAAQVALQQLNQSMQNLEVKATVSGVLTEMPLETGMAVQSGTQVGIIQRLDPIKIKAQLTEDETKLVGSKTEMSYSLTGNATKFKGPISYLAKVMDPESKSYEINLEVPNKDILLKPGMKVKLQMSDDKDQIVVTVPTYSIVKEGESAFVYVVSGDIVEKRSIKLGRLNEPNQEVTSGLKEGELVVKNNPSALIDKAKVQMTAVEAQ